MHQVRSNIAVRRFRKAACRKMQGAWPSGRSPSILDMRVEVYMSQDRGSLAIASAGTKLFRANIPSNLSLRYGLSVVGFLMRLRTLTATSCVMD